MLPSEFFQSFEVFSELKGTTEPSKYFATTDEQRKNSANTLFNYVNKLYEKGYSSPKKVAKGIDEFLSNNLAIHVLDPAVCTRFMTHFGLYCKTIRNLGTDKHKKHLFEATALKHVGCYGLTEFGHGSDVRGIETTAEYDEETEEFILNSPNDYSIKFWIGGLAKVCNHAVITAQLITKGKGHGVHAFICPIRDTANHLPLSGCEIGDCGEKKGLNGVDNGWIRFKNFRIPRDNLLNKFGTVEKDGKIQFNFIDFYRHI